MVKEQIHDRIERIQAAIAIFRTQIEQIEIEQIESSGEVAPAECLVMSYQAQGSRAAYWYYKLQANLPIFPISRDKSKNSKYKRLGKAGSPAHIDAVMQVMRRVLINELSKAMKSLEESLLDVYFDE